MNKEILLQPNTVYHIYNHANGNENLFKSEANYFFFLDKYQYYIEPIAKTFAYCLMPNHLHLMVQIKSENELKQAYTNFKIAKGIEAEKSKILNDADVSIFISKTFGNLFSSYTQAFNKQQGRKGNLFMTNFKRKLIDNQAYYARLIFYIHNNPVHHNFVVNMQDWKFSSYKAYLQNGKTKVDKDQVLQWFGNVNEFKKFHSVESIDLTFNL